MIIYHVVFSHIDLDVYIQNISNDNVLSVTDNEIHEDMILETYDAKQIWKKVAFAYKNHFTLTNHHSQKLLFSSSASNFGLKGKPKSNLC